MEKRDKSIGYLITNWFPFALISGLIFFLSNQSNLPLPELPTFPYVDKVAHLAVFSALGAAAANGIYATRGQWNYQTWIISIIICTLYGASDEFHQYFVPNREVSLGDLTADAIGSIIGVSFWLLILRKIKNRSMQRAA